MGFTAQCANMPAGRVGEWVAALYARVDAAAAAHGVTRVESRGDLCVCVCGAALPPATPAAAAAAPTAGGCIEDHATRMLAFAAALHARVANLPVGGRGAGESAPVTAVRMGMATGEAIFYAGGGAGDVAPFVRVQGAAAAAAARRKGLAAPGLARVHRSTADRWAAEAAAGDRRMPPATARVEEAGRAAEWAAVFDCAAGSFRPDAPAADAPKAAGVARGQTDRRRRLSTQF